MRRARRGRRTRARSARSPRRAPGELGPASPSARVAYPVMVGPQANAQADRRAARRDALLAAGLELFGTRSYDETTVEDVCAEARLSTDEFEDHFSGTE